MGPVRNHIMKHNTSYNYGFKMSKQHKTINAPKYLHISYIMLASNHITPTAYNHIAILSMYI